MVWRKGGINTSENREEVVFEVPYYLLRFVSPMHV
jgi:hypothetical protein